MSDPMEQMIANYRRMLDAELLELSTQPDELVPEARTALWAELGRRGLTDEAMQLSGGEDQALEQPADLEASPWSMFGENLPNTPDSEWVTAYSSESESDAKAAQELLRGAGIESKLQILVLVAQASGSEAISILAEKFEGDEEPD